MCNLFGNNVLCSRTRLVCVYTAVTTKMCAQHLYLFRNHSPPENQHWVRISSLLIEISYVFVLITRVC